MPYNDLSGKQDKLSTTVYTITPKTVSSSVSTYYITERVYGRVVELSFDFTTTASSITAHTTIFNFANAVSFPPTSHTFRLASGTGTTTNKDFYFSNQGTVSCIEPLPASRYLGAVIYLISAVS